jgi:hypothetical protein
VPKADEDDQDDFVITPEELAELNLVQQAKQDKTAAVAALENQLNIAAERKKIREGNPLENNEAAQEAN